jgi:hypothetical protein
LKRLILNDNRGNTFVLTAGYIFGWTTLNGLTLARFPAVNQLALSDVVSVKLVDDAEKRSDGS